MPLSLGAIGFRPFGLDVMALLTSKTTLITMGLLLFPPAIWLTLYRPGPSAAGYNDNMSPDSVSSLFPDRPIRPLPKRRLRERLSPDVADTITYPPAPQNSAPLFHYPYSLKEEAGTPIAEHRGPGWVDTTSSGRAEAAAELAQETGSRRNGAGGEHEDRGLAYQPRRALVSRPLHDSSGHSVRTPQRSSQARHAHPQAPPSTASSADGYDSFENTNNKKKRKIPTAGEAGSNGAHVLSDASILGIPSPPATGDEAGDASGASPTPYYQTGGNMANAQGISGPGRGRYGRVRNGRSPLRALPDPNASWTGRNPKMRPGGQYPSSPTGKLRMPHVQPCVLSPSLVGNLRHPIPLFNGMKTWGHAAQVVDHPTPHTSLRA